MKSIVAVDPHHRGAASMAGAVISASVRNCVFNIAVTGPSVWKFRPGFSRFLPPPGGQRSGHSGNAAPRGAAAASGTAFRLSGVVTQEQDR